MGLLLSAVALSTGNIAFGDIHQPGAPVPGNPDFTFSFDEQGNGIINGQQVPFGVVQNGVVQYKGDAMWEMLVTAVVLLAAVELDRLRRAGKKSK